MKKENLLDSMEYIDVELINEAENYEMKARKSNWLKYLGAVACLGICVVAVITISSKRSNIPMMSDIASNQKATNPGVEGITEQQGEMISGTGEIVEKPVEIVPGINNTVEMPYDGNSDAGIDIKMLIGHYDADLNAGDIAVNNGSCELSNSLKAAINELGSDVNYRVIVEVFQDGTVIDSGSAEVLAEEVRVTELGYTVAHERYTDRTETLDYFTIHATAEQILGFEVNEIYGYYLSLYDEYLGIAEPMEGYVFVTANENYVSDEDYPDEFQKIYEALGNALAVGDLPFVTDVGVCEAPFRIEIDVDTTDETLIEKLRSFDPTGEYIVVNTQ